MTIRSNYWRSKRKMHWCEIAIFCASKLWTHKILFNEMWNGQNSPKRFPYLNTPSLEGLLFTKLAFDANEYSLYLCRWIPNTDVTKESCRGIHSLEKLQQLKISGRKSNKNFKFSDSNKISRSINQIWIGWIELAEHRERKQIWWHARFNHLGMFLIILSNLMWK